MKKRKNSDMEINNCNLEEKKNLDNDIPPYQVHIAAQSFSNIASVLAGFALTLIFLIFQLPNMDKNPEIANFIAMTLSVSFIGCIMVSIVFATLSGEQNSTSRSHSISFLGGVGYVITVNLIMISLSLIFKRIFDKEAYSFIKILFFLTMLVTPIFAIFSAFDSYIVLKKNNKDLLLQIVIAYLFSFFYFPTINLFGIFNIYLNNHNMLKTALSFSLALMFLSAVISIIISTKGKRNFNFSEPLILIIVIILSLFIGFLTLIL